MGLCLKNREWPQSQSQRNQKRHHIQYYHRQLRVRLRSEVQNELFRKNKGEKTGADLRTVVLNRKKTTIYQLFRSNGLNNHQLKHQEHKQDQQQQHQQTWILGATKTQFWH